MIVTRFAPSPTGRLHLGHALSALEGWHAAKTAGGRFLLRIEDIDRARCRPEFEQAIEEDLAWLGLDWEKPLRRQSEHMGDYREALAKLEAMGLVYPCFCTRKEIAAEVAASGAAPQGPDGPLYPGTCRGLSDLERKRRIAAGLPFALRLDVARAARRVGALAWEEEGRGPVAVDPLLHGDVVIARKDIPTSYHLAVTLDDAIQGVTLVTRGEDLLPATHIHRLLQALLDLPAPRYRHHRLIRDANGKRLAKREDADSLAALKARGADPARIRAELGFGEAWGAAFRG
jgi:glutamyl-Q tRNA(Asp) synthetase